MARDVAHAQAHDVLKIRMLAQVGENVRRFEPELGGPGRAGSVNHRAAIAHGRQAHVGGKRWRQMIDEDAIQFAQPLRALGQLL